MHFQGEIFIVFLKIVTLRSEIVNFAKFKKTTISTLININKSSKSSITIARIIRLCYCIEEVNKSFKSTHVDDDKKLVSAELLINNKREEYIFYFMTMENI